MTGLYRAALLSAVALSLAGCELGRTAVPAQAVPYSESDGWAAAQAACAREGRVPVLQYQRAVITSENGFRCELPGDLLRGAPEPPVSR